MTTTFRRDVVAGFTTIMAAFNAANPTLAVRHYRMLPEAFNELPCTYLDLRPEVITHSSGVRVRTTSPSVVLVTRLTEAGETSDLHDTLVDYLVDHFTANPQVATGTIWDSMNVADEAAGPDNQFAATRFTFNDISIGEGRN